MRIPRLIAVLGIVSSLAWTEPLPFRRAVELALKNSTGTAMSDADRRRAEKGYQELRYMYVPRLTIGSALGYSNGFPLSLEGSAPTAAEITSSQFVFSGGIMSYLNAAKADIAASKQTAADRRQQIILDASVTYTELDKWQTSLGVLQQQEQSARRAEQVVTDRVGAGIDSEAELTRARLSLARVRMGLALAQGRADVLRLHLSHLTGLSADSIETVSESIPRLPEPAGDDAGRRSADNNPAVLSANEQANAKFFRAKAEKKQYLPTIDFAAHYALITKFNNYDKFFRRFQPSNFSAGMVFRLSILNFSQRARADAADAEATRARKEADEVKQQIESETLRLQRMVKQLAAAKDVAKLEYQLASSDVQAMGAKVEAGTATVRDQENARVMESQKYANFLDMSFEKDRTQMQLLRMTGELEKWALGN